MSMRTAKLKDLAEIIGGQIMTRVKVDNPNDEVVEIRKVIVPKAIEDTGIIDVKSMPEEALKTAVDEKKLTHTGDIIIKLNSPYDCAMVTEEAEDAVVPSFCAIIRVKEKMQSEIITDYLAAYMNSSLCKAQLEKYV